MSLESGRKLGYIASLINIIIPVIMVVAYVLFFVSLFASIPAAPTTPPVIPSFVGLYGFFIALGTVGFAGGILFIIAMYRLSHYYGEPGIFNNVLYAIIIGVVGVIVVIGAYFAFIISLIGNIAQTPSNIAPFFTSFILTLLGLFGGALALGVVNGVLFRRAFNKLADKSGVDSFNTAGLLYLIGSALSFMGGAIIVWIAWIFVAMGFRKLAPSAPTVSYPAQQPPSVAPTKRCPNCGTENRVDAAFCGSCGRKLE